ncbi:Ni/Fe-hydrogenase, b-type cytochrome subunit [Derxia gummosa]|uniref:Ni/Fe-hydrogenase, b-type cytochrome subunit n=1 Tax=Derxia gummosa DSM 723 TaxID=1121388 RepID=A0A8B6X0X4_9BURK|nr:Ni/Fe-hydrogenase, b-type cytochrome subunit [Derxia gummosa]
MNAKATTQYDERAAVTGTDEKAVSGGKSIKSVYVYEAPVRIWHWINVLAITTLCITGYFIGSPLPTMPGEATNVFVMGYIRAAHFIAGYVMAIGLVVRAYWAVVGNHHARELFTIPIFSSAYWGEVWAMFKWYHFLSQRPNRYVGHNPLARLAMFGLFLTTAVFMICTGFAMYGEGAQMGSWAERAFGWVIPLMGQSQDVHTWHHMGMWLIIFFILMHVYAAVREDIMGRQSVISTMVSGYRTFKD